MSHYQTIYDRLRRGGLTDAVALGFLGNWQEESGCEPNRLQGDFNSYRSLSKSYTAKVESGAISRHEFGSDQKGYGLAQWTYVNPEKTAGRKFDLYDFWKSRGGKLDDVNMQVDFALWELQHGYRSVFNDLAGCNDLYTATDIICRRYEQPYRNNVSARFQYAMNIKVQINRNQWQAAESFTETAENANTSTLSPELEKIPATDTWPPRNVGANCTGWPEISFLQWALTLRGFSVPTDGFWTDSLTDAVKTFQSANGLAADGIVGPQTWAKLLDTGG